MNFQFLGVITLFVGFCYVSCHKIDNHPNWNYMPTEECGYGAPADRIVGGTEANLGQFPWMARLGYIIKPSKRPSFLCGGAILNQWYIVSAVHCTLNVLNNTMHSVRLGENYVNEPTDCDNDVCAPPVQDIRVKHVIRYEHYVVTQAISYGDIALIKLAEAIQFNDFVQPICLPRESILDNISNYLAPNKTEVEVAGWGTINSVSGKITERLMFVSLPVVDLDVCRHTFKPHNIDESQLCVGKGYGKDSCTGDSGGPLMMPVSLHSAPKYYLFGIVSYGLKWCGIGAAVYTNVPFYLPWILDHIDQ